MRVQLQKVCLEAEEGSRSERRGYERQGAAREGGAAKDDIKNEKLNPKSELLQVEKGKRSSKFEAL